ncbi:hypothetical protein AVEN_11277-1 [Araneus ventricosus]|uniref:Uncharacterized protein n=1 Tax=Araneus ventricosus TaxID=182803 RepID=A0A4Y2GQ15_ARAVE|nr:hypothetical protein AVEN_11277-1 [Araneus ventricosus]
MRSGYLGGPEGGQGNIIQTSASYPAMWQFSVEKVLDNCAPVRWSPVLLEDESQGVSSGNNHNCKISRCTKPITACLMKKKGPYSLVLDIAQKTFTFGESLSCSTVTCSNSVPHTLAL